MSTDFVPGQNARALRNTASADGISVVKGAQVTVEALPSAPFPTFVGRLESETGLVFDTADFEPVAPPERFDLDSVAEEFGVDLTTPAPRGARGAGRAQAAAQRALDELNGATPAPIDASKVKAGDTVTAEHEDGDVITGVVKRYKPLHEVFGPQMPVITTMGGFDIPVGIRGGAWTLTAHQPAPKPEWEPGTTGTATVRGVEGVEGAFIDRGTGLQFVSFEQVGLPHATQNIFGADDVTDFVPDEDRALPTRDELTEAIKGDVASPADEYGDVYAIHPGTAAERVEALLRGESR